MTGTTGDGFFTPVSGVDLPRFAGIPTFMRLPHVPFDHPRFPEVDIALIGAPWDGGTTNRPGPRHGPRQLRDLSTMIRAKNGATWVAPFELCNCADLGDVAPNPADLMDSLDRMEQFYARVKAAGVVPLTAGGDHLVTLPILRAIARERPLGLIHFDAHSDTHDRYFGTHRYTHGTPFRRAVEEGLIDPRRTVQIGIRGSIYSADDMDYPHEVGMRVIHMHDFVSLGMERTLAEVRGVIGDGPAYLSFDVDGLDPVFAPGTGTPEIGGFTTREAQELVRGLAGLDLVGGDVVEVAPPFDPSGGTALVGATFMFEILCLLADAFARRRGAAG